MKTHFLRSPFLSSLLVLLSAFTFFGCGDNCFNEYGCNHGNWDDNHCKCICDHGWHGAQCNLVDTLEPTNKIEADISYHFANGDVSTFHFRSDTLHLAMGHGGLYDSIVADGFYVGNNIYMHFFIEPLDVAALSAGAQFLIRNYQMTNTCWQIYYQQSAADDVFYPMNQNMTDTITIDAIDLSGNILHAHFASELINGYNDTAFITNGKILYN